MATEPQGLGSVPPLPLPPQTEEAKAQTIEVLRAAPLGGRTDVLELHILVDRTAPRQQVLREIGHVLRKELPYRRNIDPRIISALRRKKANPRMTYKQASQAEFGNEGMADKLRYWHHRLRGRV